MTVEIRPFELADYPAAMRLWEQTEGVGLSEADSLEGIAQFLDRNPGLSFVAVVGQQLVGTILCGHDGRRGLIHHLVVQSNHRRRGVGRQLVERAIAALRERGISKCHVLVFRENATGRAFWNRIGGEERTALVAFSLPTHDDDGLNHCSSGGRRRVQDGGSYP